MKAKRKYYTDQQKRRFVSAVKTRIRERSISIQAALRLVSDLENVPVKTLEDLWYQSKKAERVRAQAEAKEEVAARTYKPPEPIVPAKPAPVPELAFLNTEGGQLSCSRCKSRNHLYQDADRLWFCSICQVHLPYDPVGDMELKYTDSPYRKLHWMA